MRLGVLRTDDAVLDQSSDIRMIPSQAGKSAIAYQIQPAVADVCEIEVGADDGECGASRAHSMKLGMLESIALNRIVRGLERSA